jgi:alanyl-tRNA synthetase
MKLALSSGSTTDDGLVEVGDALVWTPRFEGLDRKAHAAVVDEFRNRHRERPFALLSASVTDGSVHVIAAVSPLLAPGLKAPEIMKRLGLKGGGRPDFAQGGGVAPGDVEALRERAAQALREMLEVSTDA